MCYTYTPRFPWDSWRFCRVFSFFIIQAKASGSRQWDVWAICYEIVSNRVSSFIFFNSCLPTTWIAALPCMCKFNAYRDHWSEQLWRLPAHNQQCYPSSLVNALAHFCEIIRRSQHITRTVPIDLNTYLFNPFEYFSPVIDVKLMRKKFNYKEQSTFVNFDFLH